MWYHRRYLGLELAGSPQLRILLQGIKRLSNPITKKQPVTAAFLRILRRSLDINRPRQRLLWGSVLLGYFFLLRRSEYLMTDQKRSFYCLKRKNVYFSSERGAHATVLEATAVTIGLEGAKNDQYGRGSWRTMHKSGDRTICPVKALKHIVKARQQLGKTNYKYLCLDLRSSEVANALKTVARQVGVPSNSYSTHSLRIGGATALLNGKADSLSIKLLGRWVSRCYEDYPVQAAASTIDLSRRMVQPALSPRRR